VYRTRAVHLVPGAQASHEADEIQEISQGELASHSGEVNARPGGGSQVRVIRGSESQRDARLGPCWGRRREEEPVSGPARLTEEPVGSWRVRRPPPAGIIFGLSRCIVKRILWKHPLPRRAVTTALKPTDFGLAPISLKKWHPRGL